MKKILFLDLEETIIPSFGEFFIPDHWGACIRSFIKNTSPDEVHIFSWAIYNQTDVDTFNDEAEYLEEELGTKFSKIYTIEEMISLVAKYCGIRVLDQDDFFDYYSKERILFDLVTHGWLPNSHIILLDDAVKEFKLEIKCTKVETVNFKLLLEGFAY